MGTNSNRNSNRKKKETKNNEETLCQTPLARGTFVNVCDVKKEFREGVSRGSFTREEHCFNKNNNKKFKIKTVKRGIRIGQIVKQNRNSQKQKQQIKNKSKK